MPVEKIEEKISAISMDIYELTQTLNEFIGPANGGASHKVGIHECDFFSEFIKALVDINKTLDPLHSLMELVYDEESRPVESKVQEQLPIMILYLVKTQNAILLRMGQIIEDLKVDEAKNKKILNEFMAKYEAIIRDLNRLTLLKIFEDEKCNS